MENILVPVPEATALKLLQAAKNEHLSLPTLLEKMLEERSDFQLDKGPTQDESEDSDLTKKVEWIQKIIEHVKNLPVGTKFTFGELFYKEWEQIPQRSITFRTCAARLKEANLIEQIDENVRAVPGMARMNRYEKLI